MHELLLEKQNNLQLRHLIAYADMLGLDPDRFRDDVLRRSFSTHIAQDVESADLSGVVGTPTFFINGRRHDGSQDLATLSEAIATARAQSLA